MTSVCLEVVRESGSLEDGFDSIDDFFFLLVDKLGYLDTTTWATATVEGVTLLSALS